MSEKRRYSIEEQLEALTRAAFTPMPKEDTMDQMAVDHASDMDAESQMRVMWMQLLEYVADPPARTSRTTKDLLIEAAAAVRRDMEHITKVWD